MIRYRLWGAADSLIHALWPQHDGLPYRPLPRLGQWVCDRYDALIWKEAGG